LGARAGDLVAIHLRPTGEAVDRFERGSPLSTAPAWDTRGSSGPRWRLRQRPRLPASWLRPHGLEPCASLSKRPQSWTILPLGRAQQTAYNWRRK